MDRLGLEIEGRMGPDEPGIRLAATRYEHQPGPIVAPGDWGELVGQERAIPRERRPDVALHDVADRLADLVRPGRRELGRKARGRIDERPIVGRAGQEVI